MSNVWMIGPTEEWVERIYEQLAGELSVRRIASLRSLSRLFEMGRVQKSKPDFAVVAVPDDTSTVELQNTVRLLQTLLPPNRCCFIGAVNLSCRSILEKQNLANLGIPHDPVKFARMIADLLTLPVSFECSREEKSGQIRVGDIELNTKSATLKVLATGVQEMLTPKEVRIIEILIKAPNHLVSREELIYAAWNGSKVSKSTIDSHMSRIRKKIEQSYECSLETNYGLGWILNTQGAKPEKIKI